MPEVVLAELRADVALSGAPDGILLADAYMTPGTIVGLRADVDLNNVPATQSLPAAGVVQEVGFRVYLDDVLQDRGQLFGAISVDESETGTTWTLGAPVSGTSPVGSVSPFGTPFAYAGAQPGKRNVTIKGVYKSAGTVYELPLVTNGIADSSSRGDGSGGAVDAIVGVDAVGRYDRKKVTLKLPAGHGLPRGRVIKRMAIQAGLSTSSIAIADGGAMNKELQLIDGEWLGLARELVELDQRGVAMDRSGVLRSFPLEPTLNQTVERVLTGAHILAGSGGVGGSGDVPTSIEITGTEQVLKDECGRRTETSITESYADYSPLRSRFKQSSAGTLTATHATDAASLLAQSPAAPVSRVTTIREFDCDDIISERVITERWFKPLSYRYRLNQTTAGTIASYADNVYIYDSGASTDDGAQAYVWDTERFVVVADDLTTYTYDSRNFLVQVETVRRGWGQREAGIKERSVPSTVWTSTNFGVDAANPWVLGDGTGVKDATQAFWSGAYAVEAGILPRGLEVETTAYDVTDDGYIQGETTTLSQWTHRPGWSSLGGEQFLYITEPVESRDKIDDFVEVSKKTIVYQSLGESTVQAVKTIDDYVAGTFEQEVTRGDGYLPAATLKQSITPDSSIYDDGGEEALAAAASRYDQREIQAECSSPALTATKVENEAKLTSQWAETQSELMRLCGYILRRDSALTVRWTMPGDLLTQRGHLLHLRIPPLGLDHDVFVKRVSVSQSGINAPVLTQCEGLLYVT